jgi:hypothetical protein
MISPYDEARLSWFFGLGQTAFERSTAGAMLKHAELFGNSHVGWAYSASEGREVVLFKRLPREPKSWAHLEAGKVVYGQHEVTARPTAETRSSSGYTPDEEAMQRFADVSTVLRVVEQRSWLAVVALESYFGDLGFMWAQQPKPGKLASLYHLTLAGRRLLEASAEEGRARGQPVVGAAARRMANEIARARKSERVRAALLRCERQAIELWRMAAEQWGAAKAEIADTCA